MSELWDRHDHSVAAATVEYLARIKDREPAITADVQAATAAAGVSTHGLEFRVKSPESLARKIQDMSATLGARMRIPKATAVRSIVDGLADVVRYTALSSDHDNLGADARAVCAQLTRRGWQLEEAMQSYVDGNSYKALHTIWVTSQGERVELQFQSCQSQAVKDDVHGAYEIMRDPGRPAEERLEAYNYCCQKYGGIKMPRTLANLAELEGVEIRKRAYSSW